MTKIQLIMYSILEKIKQTKSSDHIILLITKAETLNKYGFSKEEISFVKTQKEKNEKKLLIFNRISRWVFVQFIDQEKGKEDYQQMEIIRRAGDVMVRGINDLKLDQITIVDTEHKTVETLAFAEGMALGNYQFNKYKTDKKKQNTIKKIGVYSEKVNSAQIEELNIIIHGNFLCRDLVNEPLSFLTATILAKEIEKMGKETSAKVEVLNKTKIESLKMGGLLAVNKGSLNPPTFTIFEWKPKNAKNKKPYIFVGKGLVYDTGGINLKPASGMETMKCDMGGGAAVAAAVYTIAKAKLPAWVIALVPATENRPDGNAQVPGDVINMFDGTTVEVLNTDAEGRLILADALSYAIKYKPALVIDMATLTGAARAAIGDSGIVAMGSDYGKEMDALKKSGFNVFERLAELPFWDDYKEMIKSNVADIKNIGGSVAGAITAGKFLEHFTDYPYIHLDIAGPVFLDSRDSYRGIAATGVGVRLLFDFIKNKCK